MQQKIRINYLTKAQLLRTSRKTAIQSATNDQPLVEHTGANPVYLLNAFNSKAIFSRRSIEKTEPFRSI